MSQISSSKSKLLAKIALYEAIRLLAQSIYRRKKKKILAAEKKKKILAAVGFEPTPSKRLVP